MPFSEESLKSTLKISDLVCVSSKPCDDHGITIHRDQPLNNLLFGDGKHVGFYVYGTLRSCNIAGIDSSICKENEYICTGTTATYDGTSTRNEEIGVPRSAVFEELLQKLKYSGSALVSRY